MDAEQAKAEAVRVARAILDDQTDLVLGCREIQRPLATLGLRTDEDFTVFIGVDSEADELPIGDERRHWHPDALRRLDPKLHEFCSHYRPAVEDACRKVIARLG